MNSKSDVKAKYASAMLLTPDAVSAIPCEMALICGSGVPAWRSAASMSFILVLISDLRLVNVVIRTKRQATKMTTVVTAGFFRDWNKAFIMCSGGLRPQLEPVLPDNQGKRGELLSV